MEAIPKDSRTLARLYLSRDFFDVLIIHNTKCAQYQYFGFKIL